MIRPATLPLAGSRNVPFSDTITVVGADFSGAATFRMQVRLYPDAPGVPLIDLTEAALPADGISMTGSLANGVYTSVLTITISKATMQTLPAGTADNPNVELAYDIVISGGIFTEAVWFRGPFTVEGSVTR